MQVASVIDLPSGTHVGERYKLLKVIGQGGFGITYIAWDEEDRCRVAVKECFPQGICVRDPSSGIIVPARDSYGPSYMKAIEYMRREIRTLAGLDHDAIVRIRDVVWGNGSVFCVMPWLSGGSLKDVIDTRRESVATEQATEWLRTLLGALRYMHERGIVHRDIKPANIMFDEQQRPVLIDFGAALNRSERTTSATTSQGAFSRNYAAPEQITGKGKVGPWTDFYSLSVTWYELITGIPPEAADARLVQDDVRKLAKQASKLGYSRETLALLDCNMSLRTNRRCQSVDQWEQCWEEGSLPRLENIAAGRRKLLLAGVFTVLGFVGLYGVYATFRENESVNPLSQLSTTGGKEELVKYVETGIHAQNFRKLCDDSLEKYLRLQKEHAGIVRRMVERYSAAIDGVERDEDGEKLWKELDEEKSMLLSLFARDIENVRSDFLKARASYSVSSEEIQQKLKPRNSVEEIMMPAVCEEIAVALSQYESRFFASCAEDYDSSQLITEWGKLERRLSKKNDALRKERYRREHGAPTATPS